ncbi:hypothetical protein MGU_06243 [Metarhizium guizhouense ARSEF 977]|uniref:Uncharacterized protein n=1 Tax=Metarhizium guizhouense (strain ARSEF 977) TaxID=1276136 RepID=A0A0B4HAC2_METGA|nr:hypothetical protein MGU_06243 [Metarhizium guizhouense ARSEF 977]
MAPAQGKRRKISPRFGFPKFNPSSSQSSRPSPPEQHMRTDHLETRRALAVGNLSNENPGGTQINESDGPDRGNPSRDETAGSSLTRPTNSDPAPAEKRDGPADAGNGKPGSPQGTAGDATKSSYERPHVEAASGTGGNRQDEYRSTGLLSEGPNIAGSDLARPKVSEAPEKDGVSGQDKATEPPADREANSAGTWTKRPTPKGYIDLRERGRTHHNDVGSSLARDLSLAIMTVVVNHLNAMMVQYKAVGIVPEHLPPFRFDQVRGIRLEGHPTDAEIAAASDEERRRYKESMKGYYFTEPEAKK